MGHFLYDAWYCPQYHVLLEQLVGRWPYGKSLVWRYIHLSRWLMLSLALSLLRHLLQEPLGYRPPLPYVPRLFEYVF